MSTLSVGLSSTDSAVIHESVEKSRSISILIGLFEVMSLRDNLVSLMSNIIRVSQSVLH